MEHSIKTGLCFGLTSGITTTLGLLVGLYAGTQSKMVVLGGILTIAIADSLSDAMGIHVSEESEGIHSKKEVWIATTATFLAKLLFTLTFIIPVLFLNLPTAVIVSIIWGIFSLSVASFYLEKDNGGNPWESVLEHLILTIIVVVLTYYVGELIYLNFK